MEFLKQWSLCVCISLVCAVILSLFAPGGKMNGFYKILISLFVFISFLYPLKDGGLRVTDFDLPTSFITSISDESDGYENMVNKQISDLLKSKKIVGAAVSSEITFDASSGNITVNKVLVSVGDEYDKTEVKRLIYEGLGINAEVKSIGD